jgi:hypothetical protein
MSAGWSDTSRRCWPTLRSRRAPATARTARLLILLLAGLFLLVSNVTTPPRTQQIRLVADTGDSTAPTKVGIAIGSITP